MSRQTLPFLFSDEVVQNPFFRSLHKEIDNVFDRFRHPPSSITEMMGSTEGQIIPALDIAQTDDVIEITVEIPGVQEDDLEISISGDVLTLRGEKSTDHEEKEKDYYLVERRYGSFRRQVPLGFTPAGGAVEAKFADGVLKLNIKKPEDEAAKTQKIKIGK